VSVATPAHAGAGAGRGQAAGRESAPPVVTPPPGHPRFPLMDSLRAMAALGVVLTHVTLFTGVVERNWWGAVPGNLAVGVTLFFVLSGFLLYRPFFNAELTAAPSPRPSDFLRRRVLRIVPAYWLALTALAIYPGLTGVFGHDWWRYYGFLQIYSTSTAGHGIGVAWSLCIEISFYLLLPLYVWATRRITRHLDAAGKVRFQLGLLTVLAVASIVLRVVDQSTVMQISLPTHFYWFAVGMSLAVLSVALWERDLQPRAIRIVSERPGLCWSAAAIIFLGMCAILTSAPQHLYYSTFQAFWLHVLSGVVAALLVLPAVFGERSGGLVRRVLSWPVLAWLGLISYGLFLWHASIAFHLVSLGVQRWWSLLVCTLAIATTCAAISYYVVERPILRFKYSRPRRPAHAAGERDVARGQST
jgi:peptidoglycan/LPS O-acetylase OafA/YrhL